MPYLRPTSLSTAVLFVEIRSRSESTSISRRLLPPVFTFAGRLPTNFSKPMHVDLPISHAGAFMYWMEYDGDNGDKRIEGRVGYFNVDPILRAKARTSI